MITLLIKSYLNILLIVGSVSLFMLLVGLYFIFRSASSLNAKTAVDMTMIAGDDVSATQLDLARAYIETGNQALAKTILKTVIAEGNTAQKKEAKGLLGLIN